MIQKSEIIQQFDALSPAAQRQVADFIAFLSAQNARPAPQRISQLPLRDEKFVGMWADRDDLRDSEEWVRQLRSSEWDR
ncbi:MAG TPA: hypothetical protein VFH27_16150 [Longimicrobiaceae bacterium]|nr:hypothetical protein [Longimicrobiaceae bacterium]